MNAKEICNIISGILFVGAFAPYGLAILRKEARPSITSWSIWLGLDVLTLWAMYSKGTTNWQIIGATFGAGLICVLASFYGEKQELRKTEWFCIGGALVGAVLWFMFREALFGIVSSAIAAFIGSIPTFKSAWKNPERENKNAWAIFWASCIFMLVAVNEWTPEAAIQPLIFTLIETTMMYLLFVKPLFVKNARG